MCAVRESAVLRDFKYFFEEMPYFFLFHIDGAKALDAGCVDHSASFTEFEHFGKSSGVHAFVVIARNFTCFSQRMWRYGVDKR